MSIKSIFKDVNVFFVIAGLLFIGLIASLQSYSSNIGAILAVVANVVSLVCCIFLGVKVMFASKIKK